MFARHARFLTALILCGCIVNGTLAAQSAPQPAISLSSEVLPLPPKATNMRSRIQAIGVHHRIVFRNYEGAQLTGEIISSDATTFTITQGHGNPAVTVAYADVESIQYRLHGVKGYTLLVLFFAAGGALMYGTLEAFGHVFMQ